MAGDAGAAARRATGVLRGGRSRDLLRGVVPVRYAFAPRAQPRRGIIGMGYIRGLQGLKDQHRGAAITVGSFDGIHLGHGALIASTCGIAKQLAKPAMRLTFEPLPRDYLSSQDPPARLTDFRERWRVLERSDLHYVCVLRFDEKLRQLSGEQFVGLLKTCFAASAVV